MTYQPTSEQVLGFWLLLGPLKERKFDLMLHTSTYILVHVLFGPLKEMIKPQSHHNSLTTPTHNGVGVICVGPTPLRVRLWGSCAKGLWANHVPSSNVHVLQFYCFPHSRLYKEKKKKNNNNCKSAILLLERNHVSSIRCLKSRRKACLLFCPAWVFLGLAVMERRREELLYLQLFSRCWLSFEENLHSVHSFLVRKRVLLIRPAINAPSLDAARYREKNRVLISSRTWVWKETANQV